MIFGEPGLAIPVARAATDRGRGGGGDRRDGMAAPKRRPHARRAPGAVLLFVWLALGIAPTIVAGYASPRHMYLASAGWAIALGIAIEVLWAMRPVRVARPVAVVAAAAVIAAYTVVLVGEVRNWGTRAMVSRLALTDVEREAKAAPPGALIVAGAPRRSWDFALPHALRPPFTSMT